MSFPIITYAFRFLQFKNISCTFDDANAQNDALNGFALLAFNFSLIHLSIPSQNANHELKIRSKSYHNTFDS